MFKLELYCDTSEAIYRHTYTLYCCNSPTKTTIKTIHYKDKLHNTATLQMTNQNKKVHKPSSVMLKNGQNVGIAHNIAKKK